MTPRVKMSPTMALWLANGLFWLLLSGFVAVRAYQVFLAGGEEPPLHLEPLAVDTLPPLALFSTAARNPFDPSGMPWLVAGAPALAAPPGQLRGIVVLPGVRLALTDRGAVKPGESLDAGRLLSIKTTGVIVDTPTGPHSIALPGSNRPTLQQLNQANKRLAPPQAPTAVAVKEGKS